MWPPRMDLFDLTYYLKHTEENPLGNAHDLIKTLTQFPIISLSIPPTKMSVASSKVVHPPFTGFIRTTKQQRWHYDSAIEVLFEIQSLTGKRWSSRGKKYVLCRSTSTLISCAHYLLFKLVDRLEEYYSNLSLPHLIIV